MCRYTTVICGYCKGEVEKQNNHINYARKHGRPLYCDLKCAGLANRKLKPCEVKKANKKAYQVEYRKKLKDRPNEIKINKRLMAKVPQVIINLPLPQGAACSRGNNE